MGESISRRPPAVLLTIDIAHALCNSTYVDCETTKTRLIPRKWEEILKKIVTNEFDPSFLISQRVRLEDFPDLYPVWARNPGEKIFGMTRFRSV